MIENKVNKKLNTYISVYYCFYMELFLYLDLIKELKNVFLLIFNHKT